MVQLYFVSLHSIRISQNGKLFTIQKTKSYPKRKTFLIKVGRNIYQKDHEKGELEREL